MRAFYIIILLCCSMGCRKLLDAGNPTDKATPALIFGSDISAAAALTGLYATMANGGPANGYNSCAYICGLLVDEYILEPAGQGYQAYYQNDISASNVPFWSTFYNYIYQCNVAIEQLGPTSKLTPLVRDHLKGEAYFIRAFSYFYLVNLFGDVPLLLTSDYQKNSSASRASADVVYAQIKSDLIASRGLLSEQFLDANVISPSDERLRPTTWAASALLARVSLFTGDWEGAVKAADTVLQQQALFAMVPLNQVFLKNSMESIWQLQPVGVNYILDGNLFLSDRPVRCSSILLAAFEAGDQRAKRWVSTSVPYKYKTYTDIEMPTEYLTVFRVGELYLVRAEAKVRLKDLQGAKDDLNVIRKRAGLAGTTAGTTEGLLKAILHERQVEFFSEWGHRWLDLKRTGTIEDAMGIASKMKRSTWDAYQQLLPIPATELVQNSHLTQNVGY